MRLSFYPILQYNDAGDGLGRPRRQIDIPPPDEVIENPIPDPGTGAQAPPIVITPYDPGPQPPDTPTPGSDKVVLSTVQYYKIDLYNTKSNIYGESVEKWYYPQYTVKCNIERGEITFADTEYGVDENQILTLLVTKEELQLNNITPEVGDIFVESGRYFEVNGINKIMLPDQGYGYQTNGSPVYIVEYTITGYLTRTSKLNIVKYSS
jgi:hypothetical protein